MPAIACQNLVKEYRTQKLVRALDDISFKVNEGEIFGLLGPNGAGKTTLVKILSTLLRPTKGSAEVGGYDVIEEEDMVRRIIGYAGQDSERSAYFRLTVRENLLYFAHALRDLPIKTLSERIRRIVSAIGFEDRMDKYFISLSGGEKQLVIVIRALLHEPKVCFLDEPSKSLDPLTARRVRSFLKSYAQELGMTICLTTHNMIEAEDFCDRIAFINNGKLSFIGAPEDFKRTVTVKEIVEIKNLRFEKNIEARFLSIDGVSNLTHADENIRIYCDDAFYVLNKVLSILNEVGIKAHVSIVEPSLEDAFAVFVNKKEVGENG
ncbi:MAG: ABC transporter ATP-binding protein [Thermoproteota archaeon]